MIDTLFYKVFRNLVLFNNIYKYVRLYKKNEYIIIKSRNELLEYPEREYIQKIKYKGKQLLEIGDLPIGCVLKEVKIQQVVQSKNEDWTMPIGEAYPYGIEILKFGWAGNNYNIPKTPIESLPTSIHTIHNANLGFNKLDKQEEGPITTPKSITIPSNIKSLSCNVCPNISGIDFGNGYVTLPQNNLTELCFDCYWCNEDVLLRNGDLPEDLIILTMSGYELKNLSKGVLPTTIKDLSISYGSPYYYNEGHDFKYSDSNGFFDVIPPAVQTLYINCSVGLSINSKLSTLSNCKTLVLYLPGENIKIQPLSLPNNINDLTINNIRTKIKRDTIPKSVTNLALTFHGEILSKGSIPSSVTSIKLNNFLIKPGVFPHSITHLDYSEFYFYIDEQIYIDGFIEMISLIPSLKSIKLSKTWQDVNTQLPSTINKVEYVD